MANGNGDDWQTDSQELAQNAPPKDLVLEGWGDGYDVGLDEVTERLKLIWQRVQGPVLNVWLGLAAILLVFSLLTSFMAVLGELIPGAATFFGFVETGLGFLESPIYYLVGAAQLALFLPLHREIFDGPGAGGDNQAVLAQIKDVYWYVLAAYLLLSLATGVGTLCCIVPGLFLGFAFCQAPYLVATQRMDPIAGLKRSLELNKSYWSVILALVVAAMAVGLVGGCLMSAVSAVAGMFRASSDYFAPVVAIFSWLGVQVIVFGSFLLQAAVFSTIESKETDRWPD